jgi:hypothetical protein
MASLDAGRCLGCGGRPGRHHPASGFGAPMTSIVLGLIVSPICFFFVTTVKNKFSMTTRSTCSACTAWAASSAPSPPAWWPTRLGRQGVIDYTVFPAKAAAWDTVTQVITQLKAVGLTLVWSGLVTAVLMIAIDKTIGLRPGGSRARRARHHRTRRTRLQLLRRIPSLAGSGSSSFFSSRFRHPMFLLRTTTSKGRAASSGLFCRRFAGAPSA